MKQYLISEKQIEELLNAKSFDYYTTISGVCLQVKKQSVKLLVEENALLKAKLTANRFIFKTTVRNEYLNKIEDLESRLKKAGETSQK